MEKWRERPGPLRGTTLRRVRKLFWALLMDFPPSYAVNSSRGLRRCQGAGIGLVTLRCSCSQHHFIDEEIGAQSD